MKGARHRKIIELIEKYDIETQEDLAEKLNESGYDVTQATVSRDIRQLQLTKISTNGSKQKYAVIGGEETLQSDMERYRRILKEALISMDIAGNLLVIKTSVGMAMAVAAALDAMHIRGIIGSIAGDDTIMCAIKDADKVSEVVKEINSILNN